MVTQPTLKFTILAFCLASVIGCGTGSDSLPSSPSASMAGPSSGSGGATVSGTVNASGGASLSPLFAAVTSGGITVSIVGTGLSTTADASGRFSFDGVPAGDIQIQFMGPNVNATIIISAVQRNERIEIVVVANGSAAELESNSRRGADGKVEIEGRISAVDAVARTVQIGGNVVHVPASTVIRHGSQLFQFSDLHVGDRVHIRAIPGISTIEAQEIEVQNQDGPGPNGNDRELEGTVQSLTGSCPALSFTVNGTDVMTSASTRFEDGLCSAIHNGTHVEVKGRLQNGKVLATRVEIEDQEEVERELEGTVQSLTGSCPTLAFRVNGTDVMTNASTMFKDSRCSAIANGTRVEVNGRLQNGKVLATRVEIKKD